MNDHRLIDAIERIVVAGVAMTNTALVRSRPNLELTLQQWRVLVVLGEARDGHSVGEISRQLAVTMPATGRQLRRMEERGLLTLEPDDHDRRVTRARLTEAGTSARTSILLDRRTSIATAIGDLRADPDLIDGLVRIAAALETAEAGR